MHDVGHLFQAFVSPAIFFSATALLILSINTRLMGIVSRLRRYVHAKHDASKNLRPSEADAYAAQIASIQKRPELMFALIALAGTLLSCLFLGLGLYWNVAAESAAIVFVLSMIPLLVCAAYFFREVTLALRSVQHEAHDLRD